MVDVLVLGVSQHPFGQIHAEQPACKRRDERAAESRSTSRVQHVEAMRLLKARILQHCRDERWRTIGQPCELRFEARRKAVESRLDETIRCAFGHISTRA